MVNAYLIGDKYLFNKKSPIINNKFFDGIILILILTKGIEILSTYWCQAQIV